VAFGAILLLSVNLKVIVMGGYVCLKSEPKSNALRQRRLRIRRRFEATGEAWLFTHCRECGAPIEPSFSRGFCPRTTGRACRKEFFKKVQVRGWLTITFADRSLSQAVSKAVLHG